VLNNIETGVAPASIELSPDGTHFALAGMGSGGNWKIQVWDAVAGRLLWEQAFGPIGVVDAHWSRDGTTVSAAISPGQSVLYDAGTGTLLSHVLGKGPIVTSVAWNAAGTAFAIGLDVGGTSPNEARVFVLENGQPRQVQSAALPAMGSDVVVRFASGGGTLF